MIWISLSFYLFRQSSSPSPSQSAASMIDMKHDVHPGDTRTAEQQAESDESDGNKKGEEKTSRGVKGAKKDPKPRAKKAKKKKDTHDYRTIKLETPSPREISHQASMKEIKDKVQNLTLTHPVYIGREKLVSMLLEMYIDPTQIEDSMWEQVPVWDEIAKVRGSHPVIHGLDECDAYRDKVTPLDRRVGIAGMFNTGTNLLAILLQHNCAIPERVEKMGRKKGHGMEWQVPWGKHSPVWYRGQGHVHNFIGRIPEESIMVAVMVRHAHDWMSSMCRHGYTAKWNRTAKNCPNLYTNNTVTAKFGPGPSTHDSLAHMWNDWNGAYYDGNVSRLMIRFEDVIFFPKETSRKVCNCVGGKLVTPKEKDGLFHYVIDSAKTGPGHGPGQKRNGLIDAWIKYGKARKTTLHKSDLEFASQHVRRDIMDSLEWDFPEIPDKR